MIGYYQVLIPESPKRFELNSFKLAAIFETVLLITSGFVFVLSMYYCSDDMNEMMRYFMISVATITAVFKLYYMIKNLELIRNALRLTSINFSAYKYHDKKKY